MCLKFYKITPKKYKKNLIMLLKTNLGVKCLNLIQICRFLATLFVVAYLCLFHVQLGHFSLPFLVHNYQIWNPARTRKSTFRMSAQMSQNAPKIVQNNSNNIWTRHKYAVPAIPGFCKSDLLVGTRMWSWYSVKGSNWGW